MSSFSLWKYGKRGAVSYWLYACWTLWHATSLWYDFTYHSRNRNTKCHPVIQQDLRQHPSHRCSPLYWCFTASGFWNSPLFFFGFSDGRWADANGEQVLRSLPPPYEKLTVVSSEWMDCDVPAYLSLWLPFFFFVAICVMQVFTSHSAADRIALSLLT